MKARIHSARFRWLLVAPFLLPIALAFALPLDNELEQAPPPIEVEPVPEPLEIVVPVPVQVDPTWTEDDHRLARLVSNESGLRRSRDTSIDGPLIGAVAHRRAAWAGVSIADDIAAHHTRHTRAGRTDGNRWVADLDPDLSRPDGWPESRIPWETDSRGMVAWVARLDEARAVNLGELEAVCPAGVPITWGGPYVDRCPLLTKLATGAFKIVAGPPITPCVLLDAEGNVVRTLVELPSYRVAPELACYVENEHGNAFTDSRNVYLVRTRDIGR